jgi:hypothetical protein
MTLQEPVSALAAGAVDGAGGMAPGDGDRGRGAGAAAGKLGSAGVRGRHQTSVHADAPWVWQRFWNGVESYCVTHFWASA